MVSAGSYLLGAILLAAVGSSVGFAAFRIRRHLLPAWEGAPARLVELVLAVALLIWLCELLGLFGLLYASTLVIEALLLAAAILIWPIGGARGGAGGEGASAAELAPALAVVFVVFAHWGLSPSRLRRRSSGPVAGGSRTGKSPPPSRSSPC